MSRFQHGMSIGLVIGLGTVLLAVSISGLDLFPLQAFCKSDEAPGSCIREWLNAAAGIGAVATIVLLLREQRFTREVAILQTLDTRARLVRGRQIARRLRQLALQMRQFGFRWENPRHNRSNTINPRPLVITLIRTERLLLDNSWETNIDFDDNILRIRSDLTPIVYDLLYTFLDGNLNFARLPQNRVTSDMIQEDWHEIINSQEIISLSYRLENLSRDIETLANELTNFRGTRYFEEPEPTERDDP